MNNTPEIQLEDFFKNEYIDFSVYDNIRKLSNYIDGQKNASRKILHTILQKKIDKFEKVANLGPQVQGYTEYLHGSLEGTIVNMTADYVGSGNNFPLLQGNGNFGSTFINEPSATRYISARMHPKLNDLFVKEDYVNLDHQNFEGTKIEPRFYVPVLPLIAINGSEGVSIGFAQKIMPRDINQIKEWVRKRANRENASSIDLYPHWSGSKCTVRPGLEKNQWEIVGAFTRSTKTRIKIDALPVGYTLKQYQAVLDKLVEDKKIKDYTDLSDNDEFEFDIHVDRSFNDQTDEWILTRLKLVKKVTENFTCIDENNKITIFNDLTDLLNNWFDKRIEYNEKRKAYILAELQRDIDYATEKALFIKAVVDGDIELRNTTEKKITEAAYAYDSRLTTEKASKFLTLPMRSLTQEEIKKQQAKVRQLTKDMNSYKIKTFEEILCEDLDNIVL